MLTVLAWLVVALLAGPAPGATYKGFSVTATKAERKRDVTLYDKSWTGGGGKTTQYAGDGHWLIVVTVKFEGDPSASAQLPLRRRGRQGRDPARRHLPPRQDGPGLILAQLLDRQVMERLGPEIGADQVQHGADQGNEAVSLPSAGGVQPAGRVPEAGRSGAAPGFLTVQERAAAAPVQRPTRCP